jgi:hypothetical protein
MRSTCLTIARMHHSWFHGVGNNKRTPRLPAIATSKIRHSTTRWQVLAALISNCRKRPAHFCEKSQARWRSFACPRAERKIISHLVRDVLALQLKTNWSIYQR